MHIADMLLNYFDITNIYYGQSFENTVFSYFNVSPCIFHFNNW